MGILLITLSLVQGPSGRVPGDLLQLDSWMSGLFDSYLEAFPEIPARPDTPVREWLLDLAGTRAGAALRDALPLLGRTRDGDLRSALKRYLCACKTYLEAFAEARRVTGALPAPDSAACSRAESGLFEADDAWLRSGLSLFDLLAEEGWR